MKRMCDDDYYALVRSLNEEQRQFFYHVLHSVKTKNDPLRLFLSGGAGVGKSTVTNALYEALTRYLNSTAGENPDDIKVVKTGLTGKAEYNIQEGIHYICILSYLSIKVFSIVHWIMTN